MYFFFRSFVERITEMIYLLCNIPISDNIIRQTATDTEAVNKKVYVKVDDGRLKFFRARIDVFFRRPATDW